MKCFLFMDYATDMEYTIEADTLEEANEINKDLGIGDPVLIAEIKKIRLPNEFSALANEGE